MVVDLADTINPLRSFLALRAENHSVPRHSTGGVDSFVFFSRKLDGSFFGWNLVGVPRGGLRLRVRVDWKVMHSIIAIPRRQGRADRLFLFLILILIVVVQVLLLLNLLAITHAIRPSAIVTELMTAQASGKK
jgi:hypothetical protein